MKLTEIETLLKSRSEDRRAAGWQQIIELAEAIMDKSTNEEIVGLGLSNLSLPSEGYSGPDVWRAERFLILVLTESGNPFWKENFERLLSMIDASDFSWTYTIDFLKKSLDDYWFSLRHVKQKTEEYTYIRKRMKEFIPDYLQDIIKLLPSLTIKISGLRYVQNISGQQTLAESLTNQTKYAVSFYAQDLDASEADLLALTPIEVKLKNMLQTWYDDNYSLALEKYIPDYLNWIRKHEHELKHFVTLRDTDKAVQAFVDFGFTAEEIKDILSYVSEERPSELENKEIFERILNYYKAHPDKELQKMANRVYDKYFMSREKNSKRVIKELKLPKTLPQTVEEALKFVKDLKLEDFEIGNKNAGELMKPDYSQELNDTIKFASDVSYGYETVYGLSLGLENSFSELHAEMLVELDDIEKKKMKKDAFVYKSKGEAFFPLQDYTNTALRVGQNVSGDAYICLPGMKSITGCTPVARVAHDACESFCTIEGNSLAEYLCRYALTIWGEENMRQEAIQDYLEKTKMAFAKS